MVGATQSAALGLLVVSLLFPASALIIKMGVATFSAVIGMMVFMALIHRIPPTDFLMIPLIGIVFGGIIEAVTTFIAYQTETLQMLSVWQFGDFSGVLAGRYELLWLTGGLCVLAYIIADKLTIVGLGDNIALNLGISKRQVTWLGVGMVAMMSAVVVVTVGMIPFIGLVVPNIVSRLMGISYVAVYQPSPCWGHQPSYCAILSDALFVIHLKCLSRLCLAWSVRCCSYGCCCVPLLSNNYVFAVLSE